MLEHRPTIRRHALGESDQVREVAADADARLQAALADIAGGNESGS